ncbi:hypothetical protein Pan14r_28520 [Crateriforma conspicua]|uniref:Uncharacterized protein n=1 Tax=Crateriforma conspicua TaxID=2527996 RepID=A0A5C5Y8F2_9PLAN|nr:hypothetical protein Mal65_43210 [Crateriforma conspicua]TWT70545.1 hypothetical protein Pan14r_28520 [Crateriforma conspicua]
MSVEFAGLESVLYEQIRSCPWHTLGQTEMPDKATEASKSQPFVFVII